MRRPGAGGEPAAVAERDARSTGATSTHQAETPAPRPEAAAEPAPIRVTVDLPGELEGIVGPPAELARRAQRALVLDRLRAGEISQGTAARPLGLTRYDILDLMAEYEIPSGPLTAEEMREEIETVRRLAESRVAGAGSRR